MSEPGRLERAEALLESVLRPGASEPGLLAREYPLVFDARFPGRIALVEKDDRVLSACTLIVREAVLPDARLRIGLIGSVATDPEHRRQGLASRVLGKAQRVLSREGCVLALLWADDPRFYEDRGWMGVGSEVDFALDLERFRGLDRSSRVRAAAGDDWAAIHRLYSRHPERVERTPEETAALLRCPAMETLVFSRGGEIEAYSCSGRGADLQHTVHEWSGSNDAVLELVEEHGRRAVERGDCESLFVMTPPTATSLHAQLTSRGARESRGILGLGRLLNPDSAAELLRTRLPAEVRVSVEADSPEPPRLTLTGPRGSIPLDGARLTSALFAPRSGQSALPDLEEQLGIALPKLPIELFLWGLDSI